jgi:ATP-citrate lyase beta-subunit
VNLVYTKKQMARVKLTEYRAKTLLVDDYSGVAIHAASLAEDLARLSIEKKYIIKVDQGIKQRGKQGLIRLNVTKSTAKKAVPELGERGFDQFIAEPMFAHDTDEEKYLSIERVREGFRFLYSPKGGVSVEEHLESMERYDDAKDVPLPSIFLSHVTEVMNREHLSFVEVNPVVVRGDECILLDAAVLADSAGGRQASWSEADIVEPGKKSEAEQTIAGLNMGSPASFSFRVLNPNGAIWLLLSGGGASITIADEAANRGKAHMIGNYGEYSGGPTREETQLYTEAVLRQVFSSNAPKKAIVIAGGVANFTDVKKTFAGIIDALQQQIKELRAADIKIYVRRGGPNEKEGLELMERFLKKHSIYGSVHGSDKLLTTVVDEALEHVDA